jgi:hypothetical protein
LLVGENRDAGDVSSVPDKDPNSEDEKIGDGEGQTFSEYIAQRTREFNVATREHPHDINLWFKFVEFQDEAATFHRSSTAAPVSNKHDYLSITCILG